MFNTKLYAEEEMFMDMSTEEETNLADGVQIDEVKEESTNRKGKSMKGKKKVAKI